MSESLVTIFGFILASSGLTAAVVGYFNRRKTNGEALIANNTGEKMASDDWREFGLEQKKLKEELRKEFNDRINELQVQHAKETAYLNKRIDELGEEKALLARQTEEKNGRIIVLEGQVLELQKQVKKYEEQKLNVEQAKEIIHTAVDQAAAQIKTVSEGNITK